MRRLTLVAVAFALVPIASPADAATTRPRWELETFTGSVTATRARDATLTCADAANGPVEEVVSGRYAVSFTLNPQDSKQIIRSDRKGRPRTPFALNLRFNIARITREKIRTLTRNADGTCTESFRDCEKTGTPTTRPDKFTVRTRRRTVNQRMAGAFIEDVAIRCAPQSANPNTVLPSTGPMFGTFLDEDVGLSHFRHRTTVVFADRTDRPGDGEVTSRVRARLTYKRIAPRTTRG
jgi:hypothetical protein